MLNSRKLLVENHVIKYLFFAILVTFDLLANCEAAIIANPENKSSKVNQRKIKDISTTLDPTDEDEFNQESRNIHKDTQQEEHFIKDGYQTGSTEEDGTLEMEATVTKSGVKLSLRGSTVYSCMNRMMLWGNKMVNLCRGIHLITINQATGQVMRSESYMTWQPASDAQLIRALGEIEDGRLLIFLGMPDFTSSMGTDAMDVLMSLGSNYAESTSTIESWCFIAYNRGRTVLEMVILDSMVGINATIVSPLQVRFALPLLHGRQCDWYGQVGFEDRKTFCETYSGYGAFCSCHGIPWSLRSITDLNFPLREVIPVAIITARRLNNVLYQVGQIRNNPGGIQTPITVFVDGQNAEARMLGQLINITIVEDVADQPEDTKKMDTVASSAVRINHHLRFSIKGIFRQYPEADKAIILEDDLELAPDFISYFHQTAPLLSSDKNLLCVNAYNYNAFNHTAIDPSRLYRTKGVPCYGWMVTRKTAFEMLKNWSPTKHSSDWDLWLRFSMVTKTQRQVLIPEIPRTKHVGGGGSHVTGLEQYIYFNQRPINTIPDVTIDIKSAEEMTYIEHHFEAIRSAKVLRYKDHHPCQDNLIPKDKVNGTYVMYAYQLAEGGPSKAFLMACTCFGVYDRGFHETMRMMITIPFFGNRLYIVGCPNSPFCLAKDPDDIYRPKPQDVTYANNHPFRKTEINTYISKRVPAISLQEAFQLSNLELFTQTSYG